MLLWGSCARVLSLQLCPTLWDPIDCSPPVPSVHGILQARILEWVAMPSSRASSQPRDQTRGLLRWHEDSFPSEPVEKPWKHLQRPSNTSNHTCFIPSDGSPSQRWLTAAFLPWHLAPTSTLDPQDRSPRKALRGLKKHASAHYQKQDQGQTHRAQD